MVNKDWQWLSKKELECLMRVEELDESIVIKFKEEDPHKFKIDVDIQESFEIPDGKKLVLVSYSDTKREFETIYDVINHFSDNPYLRNTIRTEGNEEYRKIRSRFFMIPFEFSKLCMLLIGRMCHPEFQNLTLPEIVESIKDEVSSIEHDKSHEVRDKIEDEL